MAKKEMYLGPSDDESEVQVNNSDALLKEAQSLLDEKDIYYVGDELYNVLESFLKEGNHENIKDTVDEIKTILQITRYTKEAA